MSTCSRCGGQLFAGDNFCQLCGTPATPTAGAGMTPGPSSGTVGPPQGPSGWWAAPSGPPTDPPGAGGQVTTGVPPAPALHAPTSFWHQRRAIVLVAAVVVALGIGGAFTLLDSDDGAESGSAGVVDGRGFPVSLSEMPTAEPEELWVSDELSDDGTILGLDGDGSRVVALVEESDGNGEVVALDRSTGEEVWSTRVDGDPYSIHLEGSTVVVVNDGEYDDVDEDTSDGNITALNVSDGEERWSTELGPSLILAGTIGDRLLISSSGDGDGELVALDLSNGEEQWAEDADVFATWGDVVYAVDDGALRATDLDDGGERWTIDVDEEASGIAANGSVVAIAVDDEVEAFSTADGEDAWEVDSGGEGAGVTVVDDGLLWVSDGEGGGQAVDADGKEKWDADGYPGSSFTQRGRLYFYEDEELVIVDTGSGDVVASAELASLQEYESYGPSFSSNGIIDIEDGDELVALDLATLEELWTNRTDDYPAALAPIRGGVAYANSDGEVVFLG